MLRLLLKSEMIKYTKLEFYICTYIYTCTIHVVMYTYVLPEMTSPTKLQNDDFLYVYAHVVVRDFR